MSQIHALVIDDNPQNLRVLVRLLGRQNIRCTEVGNPIHLHALLPTLDPIDLVFLDLEMPGLDGYTVKTVIRSHISDVHIIAYTVHISEISAVRAMGFDGFLGKPVDDIRFPDQLARILNGEPVWDRA